MLSPHGFPSEITSCRHIPANSGGFQANTPSTDAPQHRDCPPFPRNPLSPALRSGPTTAPGASLQKQIPSSDVIVVSLAEHNGSYAAAFKNLYDWTSRIEQKPWSDKPMLLMASSPGGRGGSTVLESAKATFPRMGADLRATFSLPSFHDNFSAESGITEPALAAELKSAVATITS